MTEDLSDVSDELLLARLRETDDPWTPGVVEEIARRGPQFLDPAPHLRQSWDQNMQNLAAGMQQFAEAAASLQSQVSASFEGTARVLRHFAQSVHESMLSIDLVALTAADEVRRAFLLLARVADQLVPVNLRGRLADVEALLTIARDDGIAVCWVPPAPVLDELLGARTTADRYDVLAARRDEILDACEFVLEGLSGTLVQECREAIACARAGFDGPAQSHATNVFDSVVWSRFERPRHAKRFANQQRDETWAADFFEIMAIAPVVTTHAYWSTSDPPARTFNRNGIAHDVGNPAVHGVGLVIAAVLAATSVVRQFHDADHPTGPDEL